MLSHLKANLKLTRARQILGIDRAVAYTLFSRGWQLVAGFGSVLLAARFLSPIQQGFFYTFASVLSLQIFFELGLTYVILQFASHERAHLNWTSQGTLEGDSNAKARLGSLIRLALRWYAIGAGLLALILVPVGLWFFSASPDVASAGIWQLPWVWLVLTTVGTFILSPVFAILEGCGLVAEVARFRFSQDLAAYPVYWLSLVFGVGLFANPMLQTVRLLASASWLVRYQRRFLVDQLGFRLPGVTIDWRREVWPMQWKIAISWFSGYFITQLFNPVLFVYVGAVAAGQMGMSLAIVSGISTMAMAWVTTKTPAFGQLIARRDFEKLDGLFLKSLQKSFFVFLLGGGGVWVGFVLLRWAHIPIGNRILDPLSFGLLIASSAIAVITVSEAIYLRAHKQEPFLWISVVQAILTGLLTYFLGRYWGVLGVTIGNFGATLFVLVSGTTVFIVKRRDWH